MEDEKGLVEERGARSEQRASVFKRFREMDEKPRQQSTRQLFPIPTLESTRFGFAIAVVLYRCAMMASLMISVRYSTSCFSSDPITNHYTYNSSPDNFRWTNMIYRKKDQFEQLGIGISLVFRLLVRPMYRFLGLWHWRFVSDLLKGGYALEILSLQ